MYKLIKGLTKEPPVPRQGEARKVGSAVFWSFFGVRKMKSLQDDATQLTPMQLIVGGVIGVLSFVILLLLLVRFLTA